MTARLAVRVQPRASEDRVVGFDESGTLRVRVRAAPANGKANEAVIATIAAALGVAKRQVTIERGQISRTKLVRIEGMEIDDVRAAVG